jgi:GntR family transcriptional regulator
MLIVVDPQSGVPVYRQLMDQIKFHIASGLLAPGDELPSTRALSSELGVNPMTISKAYSFLEREEVVERRPGRPLVVRAHEGDSLLGRKQEQLREGLAATVTMIKQLGIEHDEAVRIFAEMLEKDPKEDGE